MSNGRLPPISMPVGNNNFLILFSAKESILKIAELLWCFIPETSEKIKKQFSAKEIKKGEILFQKI